MGFSFEVLEFEHKKINACSSSFNLLCVGEIGSGKKNEVRRPGVEPGSTAWKATMLTVTPPTLLASGFTNKLYKCNKA